MVALREEYSKSFASLGPTGVIVSLLKYKKIQASVHSYNDIEDFFTEPTAEDYQAYDFDVLKAVRNSDVESLRQLHKQGKNLRCCNRARETLMHVACRRGDTEVVRFLVEEAQVPVQVCDDYGRTPMHDAFWTSEPNFEVMDILLAQCPDLLLVKDMRGHTPLHYAPKEHWKTWVRHLVKNFKKIIPNILR
mmetsp:Transcript_3062/g.4126  ORF Transcript_3062/g.4126 Transcript_3062/m.4126 type:complete len:191 (+) Transcript_3062:152-724(+)